MRLLIPIYQFDDEDELGSCAGWDAYIGGIIITMLLKATVANACHPPPTDFTLLFT